MSKYFLILFNTYYLCTRFFYKQHFSKQRQAEIGKKIKQMLSNNFKLNFCYLEIIYIIYPHYHPKITGYILKHKPKNKCVSAHEIIRLIIMKMEMKMKSRSHRYDIYRPRFRRGHKYSKYKKCFCMMMFICIKQHLNNTWSSTHKKVKQHWGWVVKSIAYNKKTCVRGSNCIFSSTLTHDTWGICYLTLSL